VAPVVLAAELLEVVLEQSAHGDDALGHALDLAQPLLVERGVVKNLRRDAGAVDGRVGVQRADEDLDLGVDALLLVGRLADDGEGTDALAVETLHPVSGLTIIKRASYHVLGEALAQDGSETLLDEVAQRKGVLVSVAAGKALVGHVEEGEVVARLDGLGDLGPLLLGGVDARGVVGAGVEQDDAVLGHALDVGNHALKVEADGVLVVVAVLLDLQARVLEDGIVVRPRGVGDVDCFCVWVVALDEGTADAEGTSARDGLGDGDAVLVEGRGVGAIRELEGGLSEVGHTRDAGVLLVQVRLDNLLLGFPYGREHVWLALVVAVCAHT
jgi:hypothetical protein